jgi:hypothetical protein
MALKLLPTLTEIRAEIFLRLGMETQGGQASPDSGLFDSWIRQSNTMLWLEAEWLRARTRFSVPLVVGQSIYDWPDNVDTGKLEMIEYADIDGKVFPLTCGITTQIRNLWPANTTNRPQFYDVHDGIIEILPPPNSTYPLIWITAELGPAELRGEGDRCNVDPEALYQLATLLGREHFQMGDTGSAEKRLMRYIELARTQQGPPRLHRMASGRYAGPPSLRWRRLQPFSEEWNPW